jgi:hypothetical protein
MVWTCRENETKQTATENFRMGIGGKVKKGETQREMDVWSNTKRDSSWADIREY